MQSMINSVGIRWSDGAAGAPLVRAARPSPRRCQPLHQVATALNLLRSPRYSPPADRGTTTMSMTRKRFLGTVTGGTVVLLVQACGGGGSSSGTSGAISTGGGYGGMPQPATGCGSSGAEISGNHGHILTIPVADLDAATDKSYSIMGTATHDHMVTLSPAQLAQLKGGQSVTVTSTLTNAHSHNLTIICA